jgi:outer membrane immunogenic protein
MMNQNLKYCATALLTLVASVAASHKVLADGHWQGPYFGIMGGFSAIDQDRVIHQTAPPIDFQDSFDFSEALIGIVGGYNYQRGRLVLGVESAFLKAPEKRSLAEGEPGVASGSYSNQNWQGEAVLRAGYDMGTFMPFLAAGPALASFETTLFTGTPPVEHGTLTETHWGVTAGAGLEMQATEHLNLRFDYRFSHFFEEVYSYGPGTYDMDNSFESHAIRGSILFNF